VQRVDVVIPQELQKTVAEQSKENAEYSRTLAEINDPEIRNAIGSVRPLPVHEPMWRQDDLHENLPNTLGWAMVQYVDGPNGEKIAFVAEAQSRWGQARHQIEQQIKKAITTLKSDDGRIWTYEDAGDKLTISAKSFEDAVKVIQHRMATARARSNINGVPEHVLLRDYNRLILKAAIDQARKEGATHIVISDAETAMMTERHDMSARVPAIDYADSLDGFVIRTGFDTVVTEGEGINKKPLVFFREQDAQDYVNAHNELITVEQEPGMRLNYDTKLPKIAETLTESKGERVSLGEHKNVFEKRSPLSGGELDERGDVKSVLRTNLIFRNPDGTPKTDITGMMYALDKVSAKLEQKPFTLTGKNYARRTGQRVPDFLDMTDAMGVYTQRSLIEKTPGLRWLSKIYGTRGRFAKSAETDAVITWYAERYGVARAFVNDVATSYQGKINKVFQATPFAGIDIMDGTTKVAHVASPRAAEKFIAKHPRAAHLTTRALGGDLNVQTTRADVSKKVSDVFEGLRTNPSLYVLTPEQQAAWDDFRPILDRVAFLANKYHVAESMVDEFTMRAYFPRYVTQRPSGREKTAGTGRAGTNLFRSRDFKSEQEGWDAGAVYSTDVEARLTDGLERLYTMIADKRFAENPALGAQRPGDVKRAMNLAYSAALKSGSITRRALNEQIRKRIGAGTVSGQLFQGKVFSPEVAELLRKEFQGQAGVGSQNIAKFNAMAKTITLGIDFGVGYIQLLNMSFGFPRLWAKAVLKSMQSFAVKSTYPRYAEQNSQEIRELAEMGSPTGELTDYMQGLEREGWLKQMMNKVPVLGDVGIAGLNAFARQFSTAMDVAKIEMYKAYKHSGMTREQTFELVQAIENVLGYGRTESKGLKHHRAIYERVFTLAPTYYRGGVELVERLAEGGVSSKIAARALGSYATGGLLLFVAFAKMLDLDDEEILDRLEPGTGQFMMLPVKIQSKTVEIGFGGLYLSIINALGRIVATGKNDPDNFLSLRHDKNPIAAWARGHSAPIPALAWDLITGFNYNGEVADVTSIPSKLMPIAMSGGATEKEIPFQMFGLRAREIERLTKDQMAQKMFGRKYEKLETIKERAEVTKAVTDQPTRTPEEQWQAARYTQEQMFERLAEVRKDLPKEQKKWLLERDLQLRNWSERFAIARKTQPSIPIALTTEERKRFKEVMTDNYHQAVAFTMERFPNATQDQLDAVLEKYREKGRKEFTQEYASQHKAR
jgi:hypothetical protein